MGFRITPGVYHREYRVDTSGNITEDTGWTGYPVAYSVCFSYDPKTGEWDRIPVNKNHRLPDELFEVK